MGAKRMTLAIGTLLLCIAIIVRIFQQSWQKSIGLVGLLWLVLISFAAGLQSAIIFWMVVLK